MRNKKDGQTFFGLSNIKDYTGTYYNDFILNFIPTGKRKKSPSGRIFEISYHNKTSDFRLNMIDSSLIMNYQINTLFYFEDDREYYLVLGKVFISVITRKNVHKKFIDVIIEIEEEDKEVKYTFSEDETPISIGRIKSDISINNQSVSKKHAMIEYSLECQMFYFRDLGSTNGSVAVIKEDDRIKIKEDDNKVVIFFKKLLKGLISLYVNVFRGTPMMVQAMIIYFGTDVIFNWSKIESFSFFTGAFWCGLFVITINTGAYMTEIVRSGLNGVDKGQLEAAKALGFSYSRSMTYVIIPQAIRNSLPTILNELVVNIKDSSVLNVIGVTELYLSVSIATNKNYFIVEGYIIIAIIYLLLTLIASYVTKLISRKLDGKKVFKLSLFKHYKPKLIEEE